MNAILEGLTEQQRQAVLHKDGPLLVLAGAGTGKTRVITRRIAALVEAGVRADRILAITFTNKAAGEMRERTEKLVRGHPTVTTFHSFGARLLRRHAPLVGLDKHFTIFDDSDQLSCIKEAADAAQVDTESWPVRTLLGGISDAKNKLLSPRELEEQAITPKQRAVSKVYPVYQRLLKARNAADFDDLLVYSVRLLRDDDTVNRLWAEWYRYVLIDEYQDTNHVQYELAMLLARKHRNLCVTGDPDQSIYGWRGADITNILNFERDFPNATIVPLTQNFRSTQTILDAANQLISFNVRRKDKSLQGVKGDGCDIFVEPFESCEDEAFFVARRISELRSEGVELGRMAVLYRANYQSRLIEEALVHRAIPYIVVGAVAFYQRKEVKDLLAYLRLIGNPNDDYAALRIINTPPRRIGATTLRKLNDWRRARDLSLYEAVDQCDKVPKLGARAQKALRAWRQLVDELRTFSDDALVSEVLKELVDRVEYQSYLEKNHPDDPDRYGNVLALIDAAGEFDRDCARQLEKVKQITAESGNPMEEQGPEPGITGFLEHVSLVSAVDDLDESDPLHKERVSLMTVHTAKGLEFDSLFLVGWEENTFPHARALDDPWGLEEERRLAYVAITRAERLLTISYSRCRARFGKLDFTDPSQFLHEAGLIDKPKKRRRFDFDDFSQVPPDDEWQEEAKKSRWQLKPVKVDQPARPKFAPSPLQRRGKRSMVSPPRASDRKDPFKAGDRVHHEHFGLGDVCSVTGYGPGTRVKVRFERHGEKTLVLQYARLTRVHS